MTNKPHAYYQKKKKKIPGQQFVDLALGLSRIS